MGVKVAYAVRRADNALQVVGSVSRVSSNSATSRREDSRNHLTVTFDEKALGQLGDELRPYVLLGPSSLHAWPQIPPEEIQREPEVKLWANPKGKKQDHRPCTWQGWYLSLGIAVLRPMVDSPGEYEAKQDGFLNALSEEQKNDFAAQMGRDIGNAVVDTVKKIAAPEKKSEQRQPEQQDLFSSARSERKGSSSETERTLRVQTFDEYEGADAFERALRYRYRSSPGKMPDCSKRFRIRIVGKSGVKSIKHGEIHEAIEHEAGGMWVRAPANGYPYRMAPSEYEIVERPKPKRKPRPLEPIPPKRKPRPLL